jgi:tyramine---L-glutamate ligase
VGAISEQKNRRYDTCPFRTAATMQVFVHEFFSSGAFDGDLAGRSLAREGLAMLSAVVEDFSQAGDGRIVTTLDRRLRDSPTSARIAEQARVTWIDSPDDERPLFRELARASAATLVIAPETGGSLLERRRMTDAAGGRFLGPSPETIALCGDKLRLCEHLGRHSLPTIPTTQFDFSAGKLEWPFPIVLKPRDGAGSLNTFLIRDSVELQSRRDELAVAFAEAEHMSIVQPFVAGRSLSTAALIGSDPGSVEILPLGEQRLSRDGRFRYQGGRIPVLDLEPQLVAEAANIVAGTCHSLPGLAGFVGFDLIVSSQPPHARIVEINPRLTTSYVGYRRLTRENLAARMLSLVGWAKSGPTAPPVPASKTWWASARDANSAHPTNTGGQAATRLSSPKSSATQFVEFDADGTVRVS